jgi:2-dehydropantoate 2-reductase
LRALGGFAITLETAEGIMTASPEVFSIPDQAKAADWVLVATKVYDVVATATWFQYLMGPDTRLAVLQNGVEHVSRFEPYFPASRTVPVIVDMPVEREAPGYFRQRGSGHFTVSANADGEEFARLLHQTGIEVAVTSDFITAAWRKLAINCTGAFISLSCETGLDRPATCHGRYHAESYSRVYCRRSGRRRSSRRLVD